MLQRSALEGYATLSSDVTKIEGAGLVDVSVRSTAACVMLYEVVVKHCMNISYMPTYGL